MGPIINYGSAINDLADRISDTAESKGFWDIEDTGDIGIVGLKLALIHSEVSEALAVHRDVYDDEDVDATTGLTPMQEDDFAEELADVVIRVLDLAGYYDYDIGNIIIDKMAKNEDRPPRHGKRY